MSNNASYVSYLIYERMAIALIADYQVVICQSDSMFFFAISWLIANFAITEFILMIIC